jgi:hypothetical protein
LLLKKQARVLLLRPGENRRIPEWVFFLTARRFLALDRILEHTEHAVSLEPGGPKLFLVDFNITNIKN